MTDQNDYSSDYVRGAAGLPPRNGQFYNAAERAGHESTLRRNQNRNDDDNEGGAGIALLFLLPLAIVVIIVLAVISAVSAVLALPVAWLLIWITGVLSARDVPAFGDAYKTSFIGLVIAASLGGALMATVLYDYLPGLPGAALVYWLADGSPEFSTLTLAGFGQLALGLFVFLLPGVVAFAVVLGNRIGAPYSGRLGLVRGLLAAFVTLVLPMLVFGAVARFLAVYAEPALRTDEILSYLGVSLALVGVMAVAGGLLLGLALMAFGGGLAKGGPMFRTAWFTGAVAMAIAGGTAAAAIVLFRHADPMLRALIALTGKGVANPPAIADALPGFLMLVAPGALAGAFFAAGNLYAYRGLGGWLRAGLVTVPLTIAAIAATVVLLAVTLR